MGTEGSPAVKIILMILECIVGNQKNGCALKSDVIQCANKKTKDAEKYIELLKKAGYIRENREASGERNVITY